MTPTIIAKQFKAQRQQMTSGFAEAERYRYRMVHDRKEGCFWFYCLEAESPGSTVYFHDSNDVNSQGFAGGTIILKVGKTGEYRAKGAWHSNSDELWERTGIDLRDKHLTFGAVGLRRSYENYATIIEDVIHVDDEPKLGPFDRIRVIAQKFADDFDQTVYYYSEASGGSSSGPIYPTGKAPWELKKK